ncbi:MAG TPA: NAD-binding protein [Acidimicrobiia bacterium]|nr:NAD-binding protein [Acidimicrobiia bacterium]
MRRWLSGLFAAPLLRRLSFHARRVSGQIDRSFYRSLLLGLLVVLALAAAAVMVAEGVLTLKAYGASFYWALTTVIGQGDPGFVSSPGGWVVSWLLNLFGVGIVATVTGALVGFVIDFLLKEGQGMGAAGYQDHIVVCGWNATARDLIQELKSDDYSSRVVLLDGADRNPAGDGVYFVRGDTTNTEDLARTGITSAKAAIICPSDTSDAADMRSILTVLAIESLAPGVRTVVEVNNPKHVDHFKRADVDEVLVTSRLASHLLARTALYPGLGELVTDIVSGGEGSELYRVELPAEMAGRTVADIVPRLLAFNGAILLAIGRDGKVIANPAGTETLGSGDELIILAESLVGFDSIIAD